jgi:hypothetical protein
MMNGNEDNGLIVKISGKSVLEKVPLDATYKGNYAAYQAYLFYLYNLSSDSVKIFINGNRVTFKSFRELAEAQSAHHKMYVEEVKQELILAS